MAGLDPRTPVVVGGGQHEQRHPADGAALEPAALLVLAARAAAEDTGAADPGKVLASLQAVLVPQILSWRYRDPGAIVAQEVGAVGAVRTSYTHSGGNMPQAMLNRCCREIAAGDLDVALVGGAEAVRSSQAAKRAGLDLAWTVQADDVAPTDRPGKGGAEGMLGPVDIARGLVMPIQFYPLVESALRAAAGRSPEDHVRHITGLWSRFSEVAAGNPHAWIREVHTPEQLASREGGNRMVGLPYRKMLNSNDHVDQAAAVLVCSVEAAERLGIPRERWIFPLSGTDANDSPTVSDRTDLHSSPAMRVAGHRALELAVVGIDDLDAVDLYSCFPSAVQVAAAELGLAIDDPARPLTVTGGLTFGGGPWNDYVSHSIATMVRVLRERDGAGRAVGLVTANGGFLSKHAFGVYATEPPAGGFRWEAPQAEVDALTTSPGVVADPAESAGTATVEAYTVVHDRDDRPARALAAVRTPDGRRAWGSSEDPTTAAAMCDGEWVGRRATLTADATLQLG